MAHVAYWPDRHKAQQNTDSCQLQPWLCLHCCHMQPRSPWTILPLLLHNYIHCHAFQFYWHGMVKTLVLPVIESKHGRKNEEMCLTCSKDLDDGIEVIDIKHGNRWKYRYDNDWQEASVQQNVWCWLWLIESVIGKWCVYGSNPGNVLQWCNHCLILCPAHYSQGKSDQKSRTLANTINDSVIEIYCYI